jgi:hypothetical protein
VLELQHAVGLSAAFRPDQVYAALKDFFSV